MKQKPLKEIHIDELKQKEQIFKVFLIAFLVILLILIGLIIFEIVNDGITPLIAVPIVLLPILLSSLNKLKAIRKEIKSRA